MTSSFSAAWLGGEPRALRFLPDSFRRLEDRKKAVENAVGRSVSPALAAALVQQNAAYVNSAARDENLRRLGLPGTAVVVTGQQVGLFLGPLFTIYKAATAIAAARQLSSETGRPVVPVFWIQNEDHDLPEVDHCFLPGPLKVQLPFSEPEKSRVPLAHVVMDPAPALQTLREQLGALPHADELLGLLERAYRPGRTMPDAFADVVAELFADDGLVLINPRGIAEHAAPVHRVALERAQAICDGLTRRGAALTRFGFGEQVHVRPGAPLSFFSPDAIDGPRFRIDPLHLENAQWALSGHEATLTTEQLLTAEPARFTTSALLRPILQDTLLPTAAYVGGPGELAYFSQLSGVYELLNLPMPMLVLRSRFRILEDRTRTLLKEANLTADALEKPIAHPTAISLEARLIKALETELASERAELLKIDPSLKKNLEQTSATIRFAIGKLASKVGRTLTAKDQTALDRLAALRAQLLPNGEPQERVYGLPYYAAKYGPRAFIALVMKTVVPFEGQQADLTP